MSNPEKTSTLTKDDSIVSHLESQTSFDNCAGSRLVGFEDLPNWYADNKFIKTGYRRVSNSFTKCLGSWSYLHNETFNIFSHLIPSICAFAATFGSIAFLVHRYPDATNLDRFTFAFFLATAAICLGLSATYHTLMNHSESISLLCLRLDFLGIVILIMGGFVSGMPMIFYCEEYERKIYWIMIIALAVLNGILLVTPLFQTPRWRTFRVCCFIGTGLSSIVPIAHGIHIFGLDAMIKQSGLPYYLLEGGLFIAGALIYTFRFPERWRPGTFDMWGSSHQIFHVFVIAGTASHLLGILLALEYNLENRQCKVGSGF